MSTERSFEDDDAGEDASSASFYTRDAQGRVLSGASVGASGASAAPLTRASGGPAGSGGAGSAGSRLHGFDITGMLSELLDRSGLNADDRVSAPAVADLGAAQPAPAVRGRAEFESTLGTEAPGLRGAGQARSRSSSRDSGGSAGAGADAVRAPPASSPSAARRHAAAALVRTSPLQSPARRAQAHTGGSTSGVGGSVLVDSVAGGRVVDGRASAPPALRLPPDVPTPVEDPADAEGGGIGSSRAGSGDSSRLTSLSVGERDAMIRQLLRERR
jgi:hypothetical protein